MNFEQESREQRHNPYSIEISSESLAGDNHEHNEDGLVWDEPAGFFAVFDGVGGEEGAGYASSVMMQQVEYLAHSLEGSSLIEVKDELPKALREANEVMRSEAETMHRRGMGATAVVAKLWHSPGSDERRMIVASCGDSRAYLVSGGKIKQITQDDDYAETIRYHMVDRAEISDELLAEQRESLNHVQREEDLVRLGDLAKRLFYNRYVLESYIGAWHKIEPHIYEERVNPGDVILLTTDGLHDNLTSEEIVATIGEARASGEPLAKKLVHRAQERSHDESHLRAKSDDITVVAVEVK